LLFGVAFAGREGSGVERKGVLRGEGSDEGFIGVGFGAAELVIDVEDGVRATIGCLRMLESARTLAPCVIDLAC